MDAGISGQHGQLQQWKQARLDDGTETEACWWYTTNVPSVYRWLPPPKSCERTSTRSSSKRSSVEKIATRDRLAFRLGLDSGCNSKPLAPNPGSCTGWNACAGVDGFRRWRHQCVIGACRLWSVRRSTWWRLSQGGSYGDPRSGSHRSRKQYQR